MTWTELNIAGIATRIQEGSHIEPDVLESLVYVSYTWMLDRFRHGGSKLTIRYLSVVIHEGGVPVITLEYLPAEPPATGFLQFRLDPVAYAKGDLILDATTEYPEGF